MLAYNSGHTVLTLSYLLTGNEIPECKCGNPLAVELVLVEC